MADRLTRIHELLAAHPEWAGLTDGQVAAALNAATDTIPVSNEITERSLYEELGPARGEAVIQGLEQAAQVDPLAARVLGWLRGRGVDVGSRHAPGLLAAWAAAGICTAEEADRILALGKTQVSPAAAAGLGEVREGEVADARAL